MHSDKGRNVGVTGMRETFLPLARSNPRHYRLHLFALDVFEDVSLKNTRATEKCSALACSLACLIYKSGGNRFPPPKAKDILRITTTPILRSTSLGIVPYWDRPFKGVEAKKSERDYSPGLGIVRSPNRRKASFFCSQTSSEVSFPVLAWCARKSAFPGYLITRIPYSAK